jgi:3-deoxy-D-manno-octulosonic acid (KDO) 8-phosphate synthase
VGVGVGVDVDVKMGTGWDGGREHEKWDRKKSLADLIYSVQIGAHLDPEINRCDGSESWPISPLGDAKYHAKFK